MGANGILNKTTGPFMEHRYPLFVAQATLLGYLQLREVTGRLDVLITPEIISEAARVGVQQAMSRLYPGLRHPPFRTNPQPDVVLALRYQFEEDPENMGLTWDDVESSDSHRAMDAITPVSSTRLRALSVRAEAAKGEEISATSPSRLRPIIGGGARFPGGRDSDKGGGGTA